MNLSTTMKRAIEEAQKRDGKIYRFPGGFWYFAKDCSSQYVGTSTVEALVSRGVATYTEWKEGKRCRFPIEATIIRKEAV